MPCFVSVWKVHARIAMNLIAFSIIAAFRDPNWTKCKKRREIVRKKISKPTACRSQFAAEHMAFWCCFIFLPEAIYFIMYFYTAKAKERCKSTTPKVLRRTKKYDALMWFANMRIKRVSIDAWGAGSKGKEWNKWLNACDSIIIIIFYSELHVCLKYWAEHKIYVTESWF